MSGIPGFFTIKWIMPSGYTHYYQAANLTVAPMTENDINRDPSVMGYPKSVSFTDASGLLCGIDKGVVYILNDKGSTIDRITLEQPAEMPMPEVLAPEVAPPKGPRTRPRSVN